MIENNGKGKKRKHRELSDLGPSNALYTDLTDLDSEEFKASKTAKFDNDED